MENMVEPENVNSSSENEENEIMKEEETQPEVVLNAAGHIQDAPEEIAAIEIPESDIDCGIPETEDETALQSAEGEPIGDENAEIEKESSENNISENKSSPAEAIIAISETISASPEVVIESSATIMTEEPSKAETAEAIQHIKDVVEEVHEDKILARQEDEFANLEESEVSNAEIAEISVEHLDDDEHHEDLTGDDETFEGWSKDQLLEFVKNAASQPDGRNMNKKVQTARGEFNRIVRDERNEALETWKSEGNEEGAFVPTLDPMLNEFNQGFKAYKKSRLDYISNLNVQKEENLVAKKEILEKLKAFTEDSERISGFNEFRKLQDEWRKIGHVPITEAENIWNSYNFYVNKFYEQRSLYSEFRDLDSKRNLTAKEELIGRIEALNSMEDLNECMRLLKQYQDEWKHLGPVPKEQLEGVITRYKNAVIQLYEKKEKLSEELNLRREQNYAAKLELIDKIEEIANFTSTRVQDWINKNQELGQWIENWRSIGSIPLSKGNDLKTRFETAIRKFNKDKNDFFRDRKREKVENLRKKTELCEKAEEYLLSETPGQLKKDMIKLQDDWKKSGPVPMKYSDKLWKRFQKACDDFFAKIAAAHSDQDKEQFENLRLKNELITAIEALIAAETIEAPEQQIRAFQEDFNHIGFVPFKEKDKIRKRFYDALNTLIDKVGGPKGKGGGPRNKDNEMLGYKLKMQSLGQEEGNRDRLEQEEKKHSRELKRIENEVATLENNIEFFRNSKNAGDLKANLEKQINELKAQMVDLQEKIKVIRTANRKQ